MSHLCACNGLNIKHPVRHQTARTSLILLPTCMDYWQAYLGAEASRISKHGKYTKQGYVNVREKAITREAGAAVHSLVNMPFPHLCFSHALKKGRKQSPCTLLRHCNHSILKTNFLKLNQILARVPPPSWLPVANPQSLCLLVH